MNIIKIQIFKDTDEDSNPRNPPFRISAPTELCEIRCHASVALDSYILCVSHKCRPHYALQNSELACVHRSSML